MIKTKLFDPFNSIGCNSKDNLDNAINNFLENNPVQLIDVKYQMVYTPPQPEHGWDGEPVHTALIIYKEV